MGNEANHLIDGLTVTGTLAIRSIDDADATLLGVSSDGGLVVNGIGVPSMCWPPKGPGVEIPSGRMLATQAFALTSGQARFTQFVAPRNVTVNSIEYECATTAAATVTTIKYGIYSVASNGDITLLAATANDTSLLSVVNTSYPKALASPVTLTAGETYMSAILVVATTMPVVWALASQNAAVFGGSGLYRLAANKVGETDLQPSYANAQLTASATPIYSYIA